MTAEGKSSEREKQKEARSPLYEVSRKVLLAAVGAAVIAQDEIENFVERLVEHGEMAEKEARKLAQEVLERREKLERERRMERERRVGGVTKADIEALNVKIAELNKKIEELKKERTTQE